MPKGDHHPSKIRKEATGFQSNTLLDVHSTSIEKRQSKNPTLPKGLRCGKLDEILRDILKGKLRILRSETDSEDEDDNDEDEDMPEVAERNYDSCEI